MTRRRDIRTRALGLIVLTVVVVSTGLTVVTFRAAVQRIAIHLFHVYQPITEVDLDACASSPATWSRAGEHWSAWAYDDQTLRSSNPDAPPFDNVLAIKRRLGLGYPHRFTPEEANWGALYIWDTGRSGPCGLVGVRWPVAENAPLETLRSALVAVTVGALFVVLLASWFALNPLLHRIRQLGIAARAVGTPSFVPPPDAGDDLDAVTQQLTNAHARVLEEQHAAEARRVALERHLADIAHDLRTPLTSLQLRLEAALDGNQEDLRHAIGDVVYLTMLTSNLNLSTQLSQDVPPHAPVCLNDVVARIAERFRRIGHHKGIQVEAAWPDPQVVSLAPSVGAEQAIANLVHNAVQHARAHVALILSIDGVRFRVEVVDDGPGAPDDVLSRLTERTFRADAARGRTGHGLGLAIAAQICEVAGWSISFKNVEEGGLQATIAGTLASIST